MTEKLLVIGGAGYIGSFTTRALVASGRYDVTVLDDLSLGHKQAVIHGAKLRVGSIADPKTIAEILSTGGYTGAIHFAALASVPESMRAPAAYINANVINSMNVLMALIAAGVPRIVFSSTAATYGEPIQTLNEDHPQAPINVYGATKLACENVMRGLVKAQALSVGVLRYFNAYGASADGTMGEDHTPETHLVPLTIGAALGLREALTLYGSDFPTPDGTCIRDYIHVEDLASAHIALLESLPMAGPHTFRAYNVGTGKGTSNLEVIAAVEAVTGRSVPHTVGPRRSGDPAILVADSSALQRELRWSPHYRDLAAGIKTVHTWMQKNPAGYAN